MYQINNITSDSLQKQTLVLPDGNSISIIMYFVPMQQGWFLLNLTYKTFVLNSLRISVSPNILHQFRNQIPFGLCCTSKDNREPSLQQDFSSGLAKLYVLTADEVNQYLEHLSV